MIAKFGRSARFAAAGYLFITPAFRAQAACTDLADDKARLACYDDANRRSHDRGTMRDIDLIDLKAEGAGIAHTKVRVTGFGWFVANVLDLGADPAGKITIHVDVNALATDVKKRLIKECGEPFDRSACRVSVSGKVLSIPTEPGDLKAEALSFE